MLGVSLFFLFPGKESFEGRGNGATHNREPAPLYSLYMFACLDQIVEKRKGGIGNKISTSSYLQQKVNTFTRL